MKRFFRSKTARTALLASTLALVAIPATAQTSAGSPPVDNSAGTRIAEPIQRDEGTDWGWLGLLGLSGLLGLLPKRRREEEEYRTTNTASRALPGRL